jgi:hypothetical protein
MFERVILIFALLIMFVNLNSYDLYELSYKIKNSDIEIEIFINQKYVEAEEYWESLKNKNKSLLSNGNKISSSTVFIDTFYVKWPDNKIEIPEEFFEDCDDLHLKFTKEVILSENNESVLIKLRGSDGGGSYTVWFTINKNGEVIRYLNLYEFQFENKIEFNLKNIE